MFKVTNTKTGKAIKDAVTCKAMTFATKEHAEQFASSLTRRSVLEATAWNSIRRTQYAVSAA